MSDAATDELALLKQLLVGPEQRELAEVQEQIAHLQPTVSAAQVSRLLPEAIALRSSDDTELFPVLQPIVEHALQTSVKANPEILTNAIFPIVGPLIRKSISTAFARIIEQTNYAIEHAFSLQGWIWRVQAMMTRKPFQEIVLSHSLIYRVEQIFLIHRETGLLLQHVMAESQNPADSGGVHDVDMVSGMLTAIQDFVQDSFQVVDGDALESVQVGNLTVWIERGPYAVIAAVIRGMAPQETRLRLRDALEYSHQEYGEALKKFSGDAGQFLGIRPHLLSCLQAKYHQKKSATWPALMVLGLMLAGTAAWGSYRVIQEQRAETKWQQVLRLLRDAPGVIVIAENRKQSPPQLSLLRDPNGAEIEPLIESGGFNPKSLAIHTRLFLSLEPQMVLRRARQALNPPESVRLGISEMTLTAEGSAPSSWCQSAAILARALPGIGSFDDRVQRMEAPLKDPRGELLRLKAELESLLVQFQNTRFEIEPNQAPVLQRCKQLIAALRKESQRIGVPISVLLVGYADQTPAAEQKNRIGLHRAEAVAAELVRDGFDGSILVTIGRGVRASAVVEPESLDNKENWVVHFEVELLVLKNDPTRKPTESAPTQVGKRQ